MHLLKHVVPFQGTALPLTVNTVSAISDKDPRENASFDDDEDSDDSVQANASDEEGDTERETKPSNNDHNEADAEQRSGKH